MEERKSNDSNWMIVYRRARTWLLIAAFLYGGWSMYQYYFYPATPDEIKKIIIKYPCSAKEFQDFLAENNKVLSNSDADNLANKCQQSIDDKKEEAMNKKLMLNQKAAIEQASADINKE